MVKSRAMNGTSPPRTTDGTRLLGLQTLRFFAAASVLFGHSLHEAVSLGFLDAAVVAPLAALPWGNGVDVFFVISGFIMFFIAGETFGRPGAPGQFIARRVIRLVPIYWLFTVLMLLAMALFAGIVAHASFDLAHIAASFAFIPWPNDIGEIRPVLALGWTLNYEMYFYVLFALALVLPQRLGVAALIVLFAALASINPTVPASLVQLKLWTDPIIIEFLFGIGIAYLRRNGMTLAPALCWLLIGIGTIAILALDPLSFGGAYERLLFAGIPAALIVTGFAFMRFTAESVAGRGLVLGGDASYALYLSHPFSINAVALVLRKVGLGSGWLFVVLAVSVANGAATLVHLLIERQMTRRLNAMVLRQPKQRQ